MILFKHVENWIGYKRNQACAGDLSHGYVDTLVIFNRMYWNRLHNYQIPDITEKVILDFYNWVNTHDLSKGYRSLIMVTLRQCIDAACTEFGLTPPKFPKTRNQRSVSKRVPTVLSEEQQDEILQHVPDEHKAIVTMLFYHGLRVTEACNLNWMHYDSHAGTLSVNTIKGGPDRVILLEPKVINLLVESPHYMNHPNKRIFRTPNGHYSRSIVYKIVKKALREAGYGHITPNQAGRHSAATNYLRRGASTREVQYILGHSSVKTTERYTHPIALDQGRYRRD